MRASCPVQRRGRALFEDLTPYLSGRRGRSRTRCWPTFPPAAWQRACWNEQLMAVPNPTDGPFPCALFYRKDLLRQGRRVTGCPRPPTSCSRSARRSPTPRQGVWAFDDIFAMVQMFHELGHQGRVAAQGRRQAGVQVRDARVHVQAAEFMAKSSKAGWCTRTSSAARAPTPSSCWSGKILIHQDGSALVAADAGRTAEEPRLRPAAGPAVRRAGGGTLAMGARHRGDLVHVHQEGPRPRRGSRRCLRSINWCSAPFGTKEYLTAQLRRRGQALHRDADGNRSTSWASRRSPEPVLLHQRPRPVSCRAP